MTDTSLYVAACRGAIGGAPSLPALRDSLPPLRALLLCPSCDALSLSLSPDPSPSLPRQPSPDPEAASAPPDPSSPCQDSFHSDQRLRLLSSAYCQLCQFVRSSDAFRSLPRDDALVELVQEGAALLDRDDDDEDHDHDHDHDELSPPSPHTSSASASASATASASGSASASASATSTATPTFCHSSTQTAASPPSPAPPSSVAPHRPLPNGSTYSVMYAGSGNKLTFKRKPPDEDETNFTSREPILIKDNLGNQNNFKKPAYRSRNSSNKRKGCRCGNATATPGKLTCCGQRCPCYVDSKPCTECKCKGCRNPHRADGLKVRPHIPQLDNIQLSIPIKQEISSPSRTSSMDAMDTETFEISSLDQTITFDTSNINPSNIKVYTSQLQEVSPDLPAAIMMDEDISPASPTSEDSDSTHLPDRVNLTSPLSSAHHSLLMPVHNLLMPFHRSSSSSLSHQDSTSDIEVEV
ncbi:uncharacterized protein LOC143914415 [Arctopsyche grandis]|uniref:uncharacterized protein LOC143914415 n=1 Tax=Arctopsyche grandis TaxID=121162 RepID=UPI00406D85AA